MSAAVPISNHKIQTHMGVQTKNRQAREKGVLEVLTKRFPSVPGQLIEVPGSLWRSLPDLQDNPDPQSSLSVTVCCTGERFGEERAGLV